MKNYYTPEQMQQFRELGDKLGPDTIRSIEERWAVLIAEVGAHRDLDPASPEARDLADHWYALTAETMAHYDAYPDLKDAIGQNYSQGTFEGHEQAPSMEDFAFIHKVNEAREG